MKKSNQLIVISFLSIVCLTQCSQNTFVVKYNKDDKTNVAHLDTLFSKETKLNGVYLCFIGDFERQYIEVYQNQKLIADGSKFDTKHYKNKDISCSIIYRDSAPSIKFTNKNIAYYFDNDLLKKYKMVYVVKEKNKIIIDYNNGNRITEYK
jgi:hypothetical protein